MYRSSKFKAKDQAEVLEFMNKNPFVTLIGYDGEFPVATQIPVQIGEDQEGGPVLHGHMMKNTDNHEAIKRLTEQYEDPASSPAAFHKMDEAYIQKLLPAIAGFELSVVSLEHVFKLSQNHPQENRDAIVSNLSGSDDPDALKIAEAMK